MNNFMKRLLVAMFSVGLAVCLGATSSVNAAEVRQEPVISISVKDMPLREFVAEVEKKCSYTFFYSVQVLEQAGKVTVNAENEPVSEACRCKYCGKIADGDGTICRHPGNSHCVWSRERF